MQDFEFKIDKNLTNFKNVGISISKDDFCIDIKSIINNEFDQYLVKIITNNLVESEEVCISEYVHNNQNYKNIITSGEIGSFLQDFNMQDFKPITLNTKVLYKIGTYVGLNTYVSLFASRNFNKICFFNEIYINTKDPYIEEG